MSADIWHSFPATSDWERVDPYVITSGEFASWRGSSRLDIWDVKGWSGLRTAFSFHNGCVSPHGPGIRWHTDLMVCAQAPQWSFTAGKRWEGSEELRVLEFYQNLPGACPVWRFLVTDRINPLVFQAFCKRLLAICKRNPANVPTVLLSILSKPR